MTCRYRQTNAQDALYLIARRYPGGLESLALRLRTTPDVLRNKLRAKVTTHHTYLEDFSEVLECAEEAKVEDWNLPLQALCWRHRHVALPLPETGDAGDEALTTLICQTMKEYGDVADSIAQSLRDNRITDNEIESIEKQFTEAIAALMTLRERVRAKRATNK